MGKFGHERVKSVDCRAENFCRGVFGVGESIATTPGSSWTTQLVVPWPWAPCPEPWGAGRERPGLHYYTFNSESLRCSQKILRSPSLSVNPVCMTVNLLIWFDSAILQLFVILHLFCSPGKSSNVILVISIFFIFRYQNRPGYLSHFYVDKYPGLFWENTKVIYTISQKVWCDKGGSRATAMSPALARAEMSKTRILWWEAHSAENLKHNSTRCLLNQPKRINCLNVNSPQPSLPFGNGDTTGASRLCASIRPHNVGRHFKEAETLSSMTLNFDFASEIVQNLWWPLRLILAHFLR